MELIADHFNSETTDTRQVVWLANSQELCEQAIACFLDVWQHIGKQSVSVHRVWGSYEKVSERDFCHDAEFVVASLQSLWAYVKSESPVFATIFNKTTLLVVDEAHIAVAATYKQVVTEIARLAGCKIIGLTATPGRASSEETGELAHLFHDEMVSLRDPLGRVENAIAYLRSIHVLSVVDYTPLVVDADFDFTPNDLRRLNSDLEYSEHILRVLGKSVVRSAEIITRLRPFLESKSKVILFAPSIENSKFLTSMFTFLGFKSAHIDGSTPAASRSSFIRGFTNGDIDILCNYGVLAAGFDAPRTNVLCIARPTRSAVLYSQMIGRGLRGPAVGGTESCTIIEVRDNFVGQGTQDELYEQFGEYWGN
jgi:superfamily II DNA or RNA helicase